MKTKIVYHSRLQKFTEYDAEGNIIKTGEFVIPEKIETIIEQDNATVVFLNDNSKGVALCHPNDKPNKSTGRKIAYLRAKVISLQKEIKQALKDTHRYDG